MIKTQKTCRKKSMHVQIVGYIITPNFGNHVRHVRQQKILQRRERKVKVVICNLTTKEIFYTYFVLKQFFEKLSDASYFDNFVEQNSRIRAQLLPATPAEG